MFEILLQEEKTIKIKFFLAIIKRRKKRFSQVGERSQGPNLSGDAPGQIQVIHVAKQGEGEERGSREGEAKESPVHVDHLGAAITANTGLAADVSQRVPTQMSRVGDPTPEGQQGSLIWTLRSTKGKKKKKIGAWLNKKGARKWSDLATEQRRRRQRQTARPWAEVKAIWKSKGWKERIWKRDTHEISRTRMSGNETKKMRSCRNIGEIMRFEVGGGGRDVNEI